jgi:large subunit ribosomal protein L9
MKIILQEDVRNLGKSGDVVTVKDGFARNYLIPKNLAVKATGGSMKALEHQKKVISHRIEKRTKETASLLQSLENRSITVPKAVGKDERLYGSVTLKDIEAALLEENIRIDRKKIILAEGIKTLGVYPVKIAVDQDRQIEIKVWVVAK